LRHSILWAALAGSGLVIALGSARASSAIPIDTPRVVQTGDLGVTVGVRYTMRASDHPGMQDDPGPYLRDGLVTITAGPQNWTSTFPFASLAALAPNLPQIVPTGTKDGCGVAGPIAIEPLDGSRDPAVVVNTVIVVKGCLAVPHVFVPAGDASDQYAQATLYTETHPPKLRPGMGRYIPGRPAGSLRVTRIRKIVLPNPRELASFGPHEIYVIDGIDRSGATATIALDRPKPGELPDAGETIGLYNVPTAAFLPALRLSAEHEARFAALPSPTPAHR
jgi:hypothetical protein